MSNLIKRMLTKPDRIFDKNYAPLVLSYLGSIIGRDIEGYFGSNASRNEDVIHEYLFEYIDRGFYRNVPVSEYHFSSNFKMAIIGANNIHNIIEKPSNLKDRQGEVNKKIKKELTKLFKKQPADVSVADKHLYDIVGYFESSNPKNIIPYNRENKYYHPVILTLLTSIIYFNRDIKLPVGPTLQFQYRVASLIGNSVSSPLISYVTTLTYKLLDDKRQPYDIVKIVLKNLRTENIEILISGDKDKLMDRYTEQHSVYSAIEKYFENKFTKKGTVKKVRVNKNMVYRYRSHVNNYIGINNSYLIGETAVSAYLYALDAVIDCDGVWEKLIMYSMLHDGYVEVTGMIAGMFYGAYYGYGDLSKKVILDMKHLDTFIKMFPSTES